MGQARVSVAGMMAVVGLAGIGAAALAKPSELWASTIFFATAVLLLIALLTALLGGGRDRPFWLGFGLIGCSHQLLAFWPGPEAVPIPWLPTRYPLEWLALLFFAQRFGIGQPKFPATLSWAAYHQIGLSLMSLMLSFIGGCLSAYAVARSRRRESSAIYPPDAIGDDGPAA